MERKISWAHKKGMLRPLRPLRSRFHGKLGFGFRGIPEVFKRFKDHFRSLQWLLGVSGVFQRVSRSSGDFKGIQEVFYGVSGVLKEGSRVFQGFSGEL